MKPTNNTNSITYYPNTSIVYPQGYQLQSNANYTITQSHTVKTKVTVTQHIQYQQNVTYVANARPNASKIGVKNDQVKVKKISKQNTKKNKNCKNIKKTSKKALTKKSKIKVAKKKDKKQGKVKKKITKNKKDVKKIQNKKKAIKTKTEKNMINQQVSTSNCNNQHGVYPQQVYPNGIQYVYNNQPHQQVYPYLQNYVCQHGHAYNCNHARVNTTPYVYANASHLFPRNNTTQKLQKNNNLVSQANNQNLKKMK